MKAVLSCGGTGGHIYPAIAIADEIKREFPDAEILFIGTEKGMENTLVPKAGYKIEGIPASGFNRKNLLKNFKTLSDSIKGEKEAKTILTSFGPDIVIGTGGYVTGTVVLTASKLGIKCFIHEQNAMPGLTNRMLEKYVNKVFISFPEAEKYFKQKSKLSLVGNPVRTGFSAGNKLECREKLGIPADDRMLLCFGGSLGAEVLNDAVARLVDEIDELGIKLYFITGRRYYDEVRKKLEEKGLASSQRLVLLPYADNMPDLMSSSDIMVSRAGAIALSEISVCGKPAVLIPSPNVTHNHQYYNAKSLADAGAAVMLQESELADDPDALTKIMKELLSDADALGRMSDRAASLGHTDAAELIVKQCAYE